MGLPGPVGPPGPGVGIWNTLNQPIGCSWCLGCCLISAHVSIAGPTGCPWAAGTSGECVAPPHLTAISVGTRGCLGGCRTPHAPPPLIACRGRVGSQVCRAGMVCQGRMARQECLGRWYVDADPVPSQRDPHSAQPGLFAAKAEGCAICTRVYQDLPGLLVPRESEGMLELQGR